MTAIRQDGLVPDSAKSMPTVVILTALPIEMKAVLHYIDDPKEEMHNSILYEVGTFTASNALTWRVATAELGPGTVDTSGAVVAANAQFQPRVLMFVGIAGGLKDVVTGDVVAGSSVTWTERGKHTKGGYLPRIQSVQASQPLLQWARKVAREDSWHENLSVTPAPKAVVGQIASGEKVIASTKERERLLRNFSDAIAVENEGYALARSAEAFADAAVIVIRGISDASDESKADDAQPRAATAAAAFAFALLNAFSSVQATTPGVDATASSDPEEPASRDVKDRAADNVERLADDLINDVDMLDDDRSQVEDLAKQVVQELEDATLGQLLHRLGSALSTEETALITRRITWFGRQVLRSAATRLGDHWHLEEAVKDSPEGMAILLTEPAVWVLLSAGTRRRCLTALIGPQGAPLRPSSNALKLLEPLMDSGDLSESEEARVWASLNMCEIAQLHDHGFSLSLLAPRLLEDLESGEFSRQNEAARFLYKLPASLTTGLTAEVDFRLGQALVEAGTGHIHAWGAAEALTLNQLSSWPEARLTGGIVGALATNGGAQLRIILSEHLPTLIAAAAGQDVLPPVLTVAKQVLDSRLTHESADIAEFLADGIEKLSIKYEAKDRASLTAFAEWLRSDAPREPER